MRPCGCFYLSPKRFTKHHLRERKGHGDNPLKARDDGKRVALQINPGHL